MSLDLSTIIPLVVSVLGVLGIGSVIVQWAAADKDRRVARAAVLKELQAVEDARWYSAGPEADGPRLFAAVRQLKPPR